ncbi:MAG: TonB-dependent receptor domain-containing protein [Myxococcales bacterium]
MPIRFLLLACALAAAAAAQPVPDPQPERPAPAPQELPITPPQPIVEPVVASYPPGATGAARVVVKIEVDAQGVMSAAEVATPPQPGFDEAALEAARRLRFAPARRGEEAIPVRIQYAFNFVAPAPPAGPSVGPQTAAPVNLAGVVRERGTRRKLSGIEVTVADTDLGAVSDREGRFELRGVPTGPRKVVIAAPGYNRFEIDEQIAEGRRKDVVYLLQPLYENPYEATISGERERQELSQTTIPTAEIQRIPGAQGDALKVVEDLPGVARTSPIGGGLLVVRGSNPGDSLVYLDGEPIPLLYHFGAISSTVNPDLLEGIEFIPGNFSATYGDLTGGLVEVKTRRLREELHGYVNLNLLEASGLLETAVPGIRGLTFAIAGRRSYIDYILRAAVPKDGDVGLTVAPRYYDAQLRLDYRPPNTPHSFSLLLLTSDDVLGLLVRRPPDQDPNLSGSIDAETGFQQIRLKHSYRTGPFSLDTIAMFEKLNLRFQAANESFSLDGHDLFLRSTASLLTSDDLGLSGGIDVANRRVLVGAVFRQSLLFREGEFNNQGPRIDDPLTVAPNTLVNRFSPGVWAEARWQPLPGLTLTPGLRFDAYVYGLAVADRTRTYTLTPRLSVRYQANPLWTLKGGVGFYSEGARNGDATRPYGNPDVLPQKAFQVTGGFELRPLPAVFLSVEGFYKRLTDLIVRTGATEVVNGQTVPVLLDNAGIGSVYGIEVLLRKELTERFFGWIAYTFSHSVRTDRPGEPQRLFDFDQTHNLTLIGSYALGKGWQIGARFRLITGNPDTPVVGSRYLAQDDVYLPIYGLTNSARLPAFNQLDVRIDKIWTYDSWMLDAYLDLLNAYNHRSIEGTQYSYDFSQRDQFRGLPIIPTLGVKASF